GKIDDEQAADHAGAFIVQQRSRHDDLAEILLQIFEMGRPRIGADLLMARLVDAIDGEMHVGSLLRTAKPSRSRTAMPGMLSGRWASAIDLRRGRRASPSGPGASAAGGQNPSGREGR